MLVVQVSPTITNSILTHILMDDLAVGLFCPSLYIYLFFRGTDGRVVVIACFLSLSLSIYIYIYACLLESIANGSQFILLIVTL